MFANCLRGAPSGSSPGHCGHLGSRFKSSLSCASQVWSGVLVPFASRFFGTACEHDTQRMASSRQPHMVGEVHQGATATVRRVATSFSAASSAWEARQPRRNFSETHTAGARAAHTQRQPGSSIGKESRHRLRTQQEFLLHRFRSTTRSSSSRERGRGWRVPTRRLRKLHRRCESPKRKRSWTSRASRRA